MSQNVFLFFFFFLIFAFLPVLSGQPILSDPNPASIQSFLPVPSPPATIPAFPEQSNVAGCPLDLPDELFNGIKAVCGVGKGKTHADRSGQLRRSRCCPVLAAWLYTAYSETALGISGRAPQTASYDLPLLPDDSETCVDNLQKALNNRGIELVKPNETCDVVYCYCGIRLHPLSCPEAFSISSQGKLVGDENVKRLERHCLSNSVNGYGGLGGCSKCLKSLYLLNGEKMGNLTKSEDRTSKMHNRDCELMGLTWLLAKNRSAYIQTVSAVLRAIMMSNDGSDPQSCSLNSDGMPLAVDSSEINNQSPSTTLQSSVYLYILLCLLYIGLIVSSPKY
uniref:SPARK domain-containing protein n=1 Tax=Davidia involucrata TaxID=16924 RepID=A0A5B6YT47_DAVIN